MKESDAVVPGQVLVVARAADVGYGRRRVLSQVDFEIHAGELWFFSGPNGSGKSTLLRAILGVSPPLSGSIELVGSLASRRKVGFVPQRCDVKPTLPMTVEEFVRLGLIRMGVYGRRAWANVSWALEMVGLGAVARHSYWSLSGGQRQRALIARGLVRRPELLILDEPTNGLDIPSEESLVGLVARLNGELRLTVLFVTHAISLALRFATHAALFSGGRVICGRRSEVLVPERLRDAYGVDVSYFQKLQTVVSSQAP